MQMNEFDITASNIPIDFAPSSEINEVIQNVRTIISTRKGTVPLDRDFGLDWSFIDKPINIATAQASKQVIQQVRRYEPRAKILSFELVEDIGGAIDGELKPKITIGVNL